MTTKKKIVFCSYLRNNSEQLVAPICAKGTAELTPFYKLAPKIEPNDVIRPFPRELPPKCGSDLRAEANRVERFEEIFDF